MIDIQKPTSRVLSKMRNGHPCRIKHGSGFQIGVDANRLKQIHKAFKKGAAHTLSLTADEIHHNLINGTGIFGSSFDKALKKAGVKKLAYAVGDAAKPMVKQAIDTGITAASMQVPMLAPAFMGVGGMAKAYLDNPASFGVGNNDTEKAASGVQGYLAQQAMDYLDTTPAGKYKSIYSDPYGSLNQLNDTTFGNRRQAQADEFFTSQLNQQLQNASGFAKHQLYQSPVFTGGLNAASVLQSADLRNPFAYNNSTGLPEQQMFQNFANTLSAINVAPSNPNHASNPLPVQSVQPPPKPGKPAPTPVGPAPAANNLYGYGLGQGLAHHGWKHVQEQIHAIRGKGVQRRHGKLVKKGSVGIHGNLLRTPQALVSQPYSTNFMWSATLPPSFQRFNETA